jgi:diphosphomevalonate decarboxylase
LLKIKTNFLLLGFVCLNQYAFMKLENPSLLLTPTDARNGKITWRSPSNIALVKYWGKHGRQLPRNPNISFTLNDAATTMSLTYKAKAKFDNKISLDFHFEDPSKNEKFRQKMVAFMESVLDIFPFLTQIEMRIESSNSFPHSAGIASSASSMSALALCLCSLESRLFGKNTVDKGNPAKGGEGSVSFLKKVSYISRLASGSACRSVYPTLAVWGKMKEVKGSTNDYAVAFEAHDVFKTYHNAILIASVEEKPVSSRMGHGLMEGNPFATPRYAQARERMKALLPALQNGDVNVVGQIMEDEALTLHALMMTSSPSFTLLKPNTLKMIEILRGYREATKVPVYFSLDAGPNLHVLYPHAVENDVKTLIVNELAQYCENGRVIYDTVGDGAKLLE